MVLPNRNIYKIFNVILHTACRYPHLYEHFKEKQGGKAYLKLLLSCLKSQKTLRSNRLLCNENKKNKNKIKQ